jgi:hypothetical protein
MKNNDIESQDIKSFYIIINIYVLSCGIDKIKIVKYIKKKHAFFFYHCK